MGSTRQPAGMRGFVIIWAGQIIAQLGIVMGWFAFSLWAWKATGEATTLAMVQLYDFIPILLFSPIAGVLVDRWNKKLVLALSGLGTALAALGILVLFLSNSLQVWHLYVAAAFAGIFVAFQFPAYSAATILMLPKEQYARAEAMLGLTQSIPGIVAPLLAAFLMGKIGFGGIMLIEIITFIAALSTLAWVFIPRPPAPQAGMNSNLWKESLTGFRYIFERPPLRGLVLLFIGGNFFEGIGTTLITPLILAHTANNAAILGQVESIGAVGGILGGLLISLWGGPKRRILGIILGWASAFSLGFVLMGLGTGWLIWSAANFCFAFFMVFVNSSEQALWQTKADPQMQGRVAATRLLIIQAPYLISMPLAGWLADHVFEPGLASTGALPALQWLAGSAPGSGMSILLILAGLGGALAVFIGFAFQRIRQMEDLLPDYDGRPPLQVEGQAEAVA